MNDFCIKITPVDVNMLRDDIAEDIIEYFKNNGYPILDIYWVDWKFSKDIMLLTKQFPSILFQVKYLEFMSGNPFHISFQYFNNGKLLGGSEIGFREEDGQLSYFKSLIDND